MTPRTRSRDQPELPHSAPESGKRKTVRNAPKRRANDLDGTRWLRYSLSVWNDLRKGPDEANVSHPATFPVALAHRVIDCYTRAGDGPVIDPFCGSGSTLVAAARTQRDAIGLEISEQYTELARERLRQGALFDQQSTQEVVNADARLLAEHVNAGSASLCVTSPPYWNVLNQARSADGKAVRHYGNAVSDLGTITGYDDFLDELTSIFAGVRRALEPGRYCVVNVMDLRKEGRFYPLHSDLAKRMAADGWIESDIVIWDRGQEYSNLRPLGYPAVFRINKVHEYLLIFQKPPDPVPVPGKKKHQATTPA